ncbi:hypothetical protein SAMN04488057_105145 [Cyclobacterium lianum]|uniref:Uncharacterized protein n=1 Tax=Cyclobacterium lianum TaxID=388280 RepID=A0A1M7N966_9BACT|nr:hypothetical protein [Cyclobacterium lianum]SHN00150.1 hypothetical protein SAMN04488057_105145 [Cyclobacterium lianum]
MGFIPIFISLGGFVFLFIILVHYNLSQKKKTIQAGLAEIFQVLDQLSHNEQKVEGESDLDWAEERFAAIRQSPQAANSSDTIALAGRKIRQMKQLRREHNQLLKSKPYSFAARLTGHRLI